MHVMRNGEECNVHKTVLCKGGLQWGDFLAKNVIKGELNPRLRYALVRLENLQNSCTRGVIGDMRLSRTKCSDE